MVIQKYERHKNSEFQSKFEMYLGTLQLLGMNIFGILGSDEKYGIRCYNTAFLFCCLL